MMQHWPHAPPHRFDPVGCYLVTAATLHRAPYFQAEVDRALVLEEIFRLARDYRLSLQAWAVLTNHYHLVFGGAGSGARGFLAHLHRNIGRGLNERHGTPGRKVIYQYWDTRLTFEKSWLARLNYVNHNPVKHGLTDDATRYPWCSARWFETNARPAFVASVRRFAIDRVTVPDDF